MHELSLCRAIARTVGERAGEARVTRVVVRVGHLRQVVPDALAFAWEVLTTGTALDGAALDVEHVAATVECDACGRVSTLDEPVLACRACGSRAVTLRSGEELLLVAFDVVDPIPEEVPHGSVPPTP